MKGELLGVWEYRSEDDLSAMARIALDKERAPDLHVLLMSSTGDTITTQVADGTVPLDPETVLYVQHRGAYKVLRRELWPGGRVLLKLAAWPLR